RGGRGGGSQRYERGLRPIGGNGDDGGAVARILPGERLSGSAATSDERNARRELEQALADMDERSVDRPVGAVRPSSAQQQRPMGVFAFGVSRKRLEQAVRELGVPVSVARDLDEADAVVTLRNYYKRKPAALRDAESNGVPIYVLKSNTTLQ